MTIPAKRLPHRLAVFFCLLLISILFHYPRLFFIADESWRLTGKESLLENYSMLCKWDCGDFHYLANHSDLASNKAAAAFFPLFPLCISFVSNLVPQFPLASLSVALSNIFSLIAVVLAVVLGTKLYPAPGPQSKTYFPWSKGGLILGLGIAAYPYSQFFSYGYSEPIFLSLLIGVIICVNDKRWFLASALCGLAAVSRPQGIWVLGAFGLTAGYHFLKDLKKKKPTLPLDTFFIILMIAVIPFTGFLIWQKLAFGSFVSFLKVQNTGWGRSFNLIGGLKSHIPLFDFCRVFIFIALYSVYRCFEKQSTVWTFVGLTTLFMTEIPLFFGGMLSYPRFSSINIGVFLVVTSLVLDRLWLFVALLIFFVTRLNIEVHSWLNAVDFVF